MKLLIIAIFLTSAHLALAQDQTLNERLFNAINEFRIKNGRQSLAYDSSQQKDADKWAERMSRKGFEHDKRCGCWENITKGFGDESEIVTAWINSKGHRINLLVKAPRGVVATYTIEGSRFRYAVFRAFK